jgi:hypothetical protein
MQDDLTECRIQASRCTEWAAETNDPILSKKFADLAGQWTKMADDIEGLTDFNAPLMMQGCAVATAENCLCDWAQRRACHP